MNCCIADIEIHLPEKTLDNDQLAQEFTDWSAEKIEKKTGIRSRHISAMEETAVDLGYQAAKTLIAKNSDCEIDFLLFCTQSPEYHLPPGSCLLQDRLGLPVTIGAMDFNLGCSGFVYGLAIAKGMIQSGVARNLLLITSETYTKHIHVQDKGNRTIFGDGAAAALIRATPNSGIGEFALGTDGSGFANLIIPAGGFRKRHSADEDQYLRMNGPDVFNFTIDAVPAAVADCLEKNHITLDEVDYVIFHQANQYMLNHLRKKINIPKEKFFMNMHEVGNTVSATIPIALRDALDRQFVQPGDRVMLVGFGVGYSWAATVITI